MLVFNGFFYAIAYIQHIIIRNTRTSWQTKAYAEESFAYSIFIDWHIAIDWLFVHRFPQRAAFNQTRIQVKAHSFYVIVWLTIRTCGCRLADHTSRAANGTLHRCGISMRLPLYLQVGRKCNGAKPIV